MEGHTQDRSSCGVWNRTSAVIFFVFFFSSGYAIQLTAGDGIVHTEIGRVELFFFLLLFDFWTTTPEEALLGQPFLRRVWAADKLCSPGHHGKKKKLCNIRACPPVLKCSLQYLHLNRMCFKDSRISLGADMYQGMCVCHVYLLCARMSSAACAHNVMCKARVSGQNALCLIIFLPFCLHCI